MKTLQLNNNIARTYKNNGQHAEQVLRYTLTGKIQKADNLPATQGADIYNIQVKSARATVCSGVDFDEFIKQDKATKYAYVNKDFTTAYIMSKAEYIAMVKELAQNDVTSGKNGHKKSLRLPKETKKLIAYLMSH